MTCIVGVEVADGRVVVGADSSYDDGRLQGLVSADHPKVWRDGEYVVGVAGSFRVANVLRFQVDLPPPPQKGLLRHVVARVVPLVRKVMRENGHMLSAQGGDGSYETGGDATDGVVLVAVRGRLFTVHGDYSVCRARCRYDAVGSGAGVALGALHASTGAAPDERVRLALAAAEAHACGVRRPWRLMVA
jgi:hypothetical protein